MSCRPVLATLNIQFYEIPDIALYENLVSLLNAVPVVQELGELVIFSRHGLKIIPYVNFKLATAALRYHVHLHRPAQNQAPRLNVITEPCLRAGIAHAHVIRLGFTKMEPLVNLVSVNKEIVGYVITSEILCCCGNLLEEIRDHAKMATEILFHNL